MISDDDFGKAVEAAKAIPQGGNFLKLKDGDTFDFVPASAPRYFWGVFEGGKYQAMQWGAGKCSFGLLLYGMDSGNYHYLKLSMPHFDRVIGAVAYDGTNHVYRLTRIGEGTATTYSCTVLAREPVPTSFPEMPDIEGLIEGSYERKPKPGDKEIPF